MTDFSLEKLDAYLAERAKASPADSYTAKLVHKGQAYAAKKLGEESTEAVIAAVAGNREELTAEAGDVLYHLLVLLRAAGVPLSDVMATLEARTAQSGIAEKASRPKGIV